ncbi:unnamed protein product, partial [Allacma fusca]
MESARILVFDN